MVDSIGRLDNFKQSTFAGRPAIIVQNDFSPLNFLPQLVGLPLSEPDEKAPILLVRTDRHRVALVVDEIKGKMDVVMKNLGPHLRHVHGIAGGTVMGNGRVVLILELSELLSTRSKLKGSALGGATTAPLGRDPMVVSALQAAAKPPSVAQSHQQGAIVSSPPVPAEHGKYVLVVDDSPSVRRVVSNMLKQHGW